MTTILFYFLIVLALAGSSYYGWKSAKSAKNRQETQEQKRLRSVLLFVNVLLFAGFLSLVITILNDAFIPVSYTHLSKTYYRLSIIIYYTLYFSLSTHFYRFSIFFI